MVDTNILISAAVFNSRYLEKMLSFICLKHQLVLSSYILDEFTRVVKEKFPTKQMNVALFFGKFSFEIENTPLHLPAHNLFEIRDMKDEPILYSAITADVDVLISNDNDLLVVDISRPQIVSAHSFMDTYCS